MRTLGQTVLWSVFGVALVVILEAMFPVPTSESSPPSAAIVDEITEHEKIAIETMTTRSEMMLKWALVVAGGVSVVGLGSIRNPPDTTGFSRLAIVACALCVISLVLGLRFLDNVAQAVAISYAPWRIPSVVDASRWQEIALAAGSMCMAIAIMRSPELTSKGG